MRGLPIKKYGSSVSHLEGLAWGSHFCSKSSTEDGRDVGRAGGDRPGPGKRALGQSLTYSDYICQSRLQIDTMARRVTRQTVGKTNASITLKVTMRVGLIGGGSDPPPTHP
eukprot:10266632-Alexandrium_andersonii.AAC.1